MAEAQAKVDAALVGLGVDLDVQADAVEWAWDLCRCHESTPDQATVASDADVAEEWIADALARAPRLPQAQTDQLRMILHPASYATRADAITREILPALGEHAQDHNVEAIADAVLGVHSQGYAMQASVEEFWSTVEQYL